MPKKRTEKEFIEEIKKLVGDEYSFLEPYKNNMTKLKVRHNCEKCNNHEYSVTPNKFINIGRRCPKCFGSEKKTTESFKKEIQEKVGKDYILLSEYINTNTKVSVKHDCGYIWDVRACDLVTKGFRCPKCNNVAPKNTKIFKEDVKKLVGNEYTVIGEYKNNKTKLKMRHNCIKCNNHEYEVSPNRFLSGDRCPKCKESRGEKRITEFLNSENIVFKEQVKFKDCVYKKQLAFDFQIFYDDNSFILIEYDGEQHFKPSFGSKTENKVQAERDRVKNEYCKKNNIKLYRIKYTDFDNIEKILREILEL